MSNGFVGDLAEAIGHGQVTDVEVAWPDHSGHVLGKRIPAGRFAGRATGAGFPFCGAALAWNTVGDVEPDARISSARTGFPDLFAIPDLTTARPPPPRARSRRTIRRSRMPSTSSWACAGASTASSPATA